VSVVIPVFNGERYLAEAIRSVLGQTRPPDEVVVVDDGSTDGSAAVARGVPGVRCLSQPNAGQPAALNRGVSETKGSFLSFLDADDVWVPEKLALQLEAFAEDPGLDMVFGHAEQFVDPDAPEAVAARLPAGRTVLPAHLPGALLVRRQAFDLVGGFRSQWTVGSVVDWYARATEAGLDERMLGTVVYRRRLHAGNLGIVEAESRSDYLDVVRAALERRRARTSGGRDDGADPAGSGAGRS
jgi:glycosyltransferase involved in cell wall biosynthesis